MSHRLYAYFLKRHAYGKLCLTIMPHKGIILSIL